MIVCEELLGLFFLHPFCKLAQESVVVHAQKQTREIGCGSHGHHSSRVMIFEVGQQLEHYDALFLEVGLDLGELDLEVSTQDGLLVHSLQKFAVAL